MFAAREKPGLSPHERAASLRRATLRLVLVLVPVAAIGATVLASTREGILGVDFRTVSPEIRELTLGRSPFVADGIASGGHFLWTVTAGWMLAPLAWMPSGYVVMVILEIAALVGALLLLGVRDWRCYALALAWPPTLNSVQTANLSLPLAFLLAAAWFDRARPRVGFWIGLAVSMKLFVWPALIWLVAARRWKALGIAVAVQVITILVTLPYIALDDYLSYQRLVADTFAPDALTLSAGLHDLGMSMTTARIITMALGLTVAWFGRRDLGWLVIAALILSPVVWLHYFDLLLIPLALWRPPLWVWFLPFFFVVTPGQGNGTTTQTLGTLAVFAVTVACASVFGRRSRSSPLPALAPAPVS